MFIFELMAHVPCMFQIPDKEETSKRNEVQSIWEMEYYDKVYLITKVNGPSECRQNYKKVTHLYLKIKLRTGSTVLKNKNQ